jgi:hypothetical protein
MRRVFVLFLILLFPLNVLALSTSVASLQHTPVTHEASAFTNTVDLQTLGDPDSDEPPAGYDFHDSMKGACRPPSFLAVSSSRLPLRGAASRLSRP